MMRCRVIYVIEPHGDRWTVEACGCRSGEVPTRCEALHDAVSEARRVAKMGHAVKVAVCRPPRVQGLRPRMLRHV